MVDQNKCISCGACVGICPVEAVSFDESGKSKIDRNKCIRCHSCESICPVDAIKIED